MPGRLAAGSIAALGACWDGAGVNFALVAPNAQDVVLCLFDEDGKETGRHHMAGCENGVWHGYLPDAAPGAIYAYRVHGEYAPQRGHRFNPAKLLLDPYAREVVGAYRGQDAFLGDRADDTGAIAPKARVVRDSRSHRSDAPRISLGDTVLYEAHVKGMTRLHPAVPEALRGSYAGLAHPAVLDHLCQLGVTAINLLPVHARADEARLLKSGLTNYWGYNSIGFFAPEPRYWSGRQGSSPVSEFRDMVTAFHARGLEVILDVVYNHTAESDELGPTLSLRGIDNALYYRLDPDDPARYENWAGCGNVLNLMQPRVLQMVMDSLRYWVQQMQVDGFRFDLATILARDAHGFHACSPFMAAIGQDPVL
ncbi:MAG: alpha-amylase family glycosyl hydrolase, partial [Lacisediminimonas sp.]|nr:alpha-amylase family glycosyl hydrolase [Lacisediminimonas sp.]